MKSTDRIERELVEIESTIGRLRAAQSRLLGEIDRRQVPTADGCRTLGEWISSRLDVAPETGRLLSHVARSDTKLVAGALSRGEVSFDRACELIRIPDPDVETIEGSLRFDIAGLRRVSARDRRVTPPAERDAFEGRHLVLQPSFDESSWRLWGSLAGVEGKVVDQVLSDRADAFPTAPDGAHLTRAQRRADALVAVCTDHAGTGSSMVTVFVDATAGGGAGAVVAGGPRVGPRTLERILCDGSVEVTGVAEDGTPLGIGRRSAVVPPRLKRYVLWRDEGCTVDGCTCRYRLEPHHIVPYSRGGRTDADNLTTLCWFHHHVVIHGMGYRIDPATPPQRRRFLRPDRPDPP